MARATLSDRAAHRQLLQARIALERAELARDVLRLRQAARPAVLWRSALSGLLGPATPGPGTGWLSGALALLRRYPVITSALGLLTPLLRRRRWLLRSAVLVAFGGGVLAALSRRGGNVRPAAAPPSPPSP